MKTDVFLLEEQDLRIFESLYQGDLSQIGKTALIYGAVSEGEPSALAVVELLPGNENFWLNWLYVAEEKRRQGVGTAVMRFLLNRLARYIFASKFQAPCVDDEKRAFFEANDFSIAGLSDCGMFESRLSELEIPDRFEVKDQGKRLSELTEEERGRLQEGLEKDPAALMFRYDPSNCLPESRCVLTEEGPKAVLALSEEPEGIHVSYVYARNGCGGALLGLLRQAYEELLLRMDPGTPIRLTAVNKKAAELAERLMPKADRREVSLAEYDLRFL